MSSREIAELTGKRHDHVLEDIRKMLEELNLGVPSFRGSYLSAQNKTMPEFRLPKDLTLTLVSGYNVTLRHRIVTRWMELKITESRFGSSYKDSTGRHLETSKSVTSRSSGSPARATQDT